MVAEERDIFQLHFVNYTKQLQFVYLYYLEETGGCGLHPLNLTPSLLLSGKIEIVFADIVQPQNGLKKLIRVHIPEGEWVGKAHTATLVPPSLSQAMTQWPRRSRTNIGCW